MILTALMLLGVSAQLPADGYTRIDLTKEISGKKFFSTVLREGEPVILTWRNSLFNLDVTEGFKARKGKLVQHLVIFADPRGLPPPVVTVADVEDLYHTGGPFTARDMNIIISRVVYRVSEIGNPKLKIGERVVDFKQEVGFGGAVILTASLPRWYEILI